MKIVNYYKCFIVVILLTILLISTASAMPYLKKNIEAIFNTQTITIEKEEQDFTHKVKEIDKPIRAYNRAFYDEIFSIRDWEKGFDHYESSLDPYGERATIAWPMSYYLESEVLMYRATKDPLYLNRVIDVMDKILDLRDSKIERVNEFGESPPIWSSGSRYGWGKSTLKNENGEEVVEVLTYGTWRVDTGIVGELRTDNDDTYITVLKGSEEGTFKIRIENERRDFDRIYDNLTLKEEGTILDDDSVRITVLKTCNSLPKFQKKGYIGNILTTRPVHTGLLISPMLHLAEDILVEELNEYYMDKANSYIEAAIYAIEYHEGDWIELDAKRGYYSGTVRGDKDDKTPLPWNQMFEPGRILIGLYSITGEEKYKEKVEKMINYFIDHVRYDEENDLYVWDYWNWDGYTATESVNYARLDMIFIYEAYKAGIGFTDKEMNRFINTYRKNVYREDNSIANLIDGRGNYNRGQWLTLSRVNFLSEWGDEYFFYKPINWIEEDENGGAEDVVKLVSIARSIYQKRILNPYFEDVTDLEKVGEYREQ